MMRVLVLLIVAVVAVAVIGLLLRSRSRAAESGRPSLGPGGGTAELRARFLHGTAARFSIEPVAGVWGVLMETGDPEATTTLVALGDGTSSLYFSSGAAVIGGGAHPSVHAAALRLVGVAGRYLPEMTPVTEFPFPRPGDVQFYVLTTNGVLRSGAREKALGGGSHVLSEMFFAGHDVISGLREVTEERER